MRVEHFDFIALGGGNAGLAAAKRIRAAGKKVVLVDPTPIGGLCALRGCNPKKVLVRATEVLNIVRDARRHGIDVAARAIDWRAVIDRKSGFTDPVTLRTEQDLRDAGIEYIEAAPRFASPESLQADRRMLSFESILIATGSAPRKLDFPGADHVMTSDDILELREIPKRLAIIGSGVVAFELAHMFLRVGTEVHMLMRGREALKRSDSEIVGHALTHLRSLGLRLHEGVAVKAVDHGGSEHRVELENREGIGADVVLNATGRPPVLADLSLEQADVEYCAKGIKVDHYLRSVSNRKVFAAGDVLGRMQLSPVSTYEGNVVAENVLHGNSKRVDYSAIPSVVFTDPPLADVGLTEDDARSNGLDIDVVTREMSDWTVFRIAGSGPSFGKAIYEQRTGRVLGAHLFGPGADENIHVFATAMRYGITRGQLAEMIYGYPTFASAMAYLTPATGD